MREIEVLAAFLVRQAQFGVVLPQPIENSLTELLYELHELFGILIGGCARHVVFDRVALLPATLQILSVFRVLVAQDQGQGRDRAVVLQSHLRAEASRVKQYRAQLQRGVVGDTEAPVR